MKVLIVGGAGYLGGALTDILLQTEHDIRVYDALMYEEAYLKDVPFVLGDIRNREHLKQHLDWADAVVWLAALVGDGACALNPEITTELNQDSVKWLADNYNGRIVFMSTCSVYGAQDAELDETSPTGPLSLYATTKLASEDYLAKKNAIIFRLGTLFGLGDRYSRIRLDLVVNTLTTRAIVDGKLKVFGGDQFRPLLHVRDAAQAVADNLATSHTGVYNLHSENVKILDLANEVKRYIPGTKMEIVDMPFQDSRNYRANSDKARKTFGFDPKFMAADGIREVKQLIEGHRIKDINNPRYSNQGYLSMFNTHKLVDEGEESKDVAAPLTATQVPAASQPPVAKVVQAMAAPVAAQSAPAPTLAGGQPRLIPGGLAVDDRGSLMFANDFDFTGVKRFYTVSNHIQRFVRAWHGHKNEAKYVLVTKGSAVVAAVEIDDWDAPSKDAQVYRNVLSADKPSVLYIPAGYANGFMSLSEDTQIMFLSTSTLQESQGDDYRFDARYWDVWSVEER